MRENVMRTQLSGSLPLGGTLGLCVKLRAASQNNVFRAKTQRTAKTKSQLIQNQTNSLK